MRRNRNKIIVVLLILLISIGFAFLSSNLSIIGNTLVSKQTWDIHFENPTKVGGNVDATSLELTNSTTVDFSVDLFKPKDSYEFSVDVVNNGSIDAMISSITATELTASQKKLFEYVITYDDGAALKEKQLLAHNSSDKYKVTVRYKDDISSTDLTLNNQTINISITVNYVQADSTAINRVKNSFISLYNQTTPGVLAQGDEVNIGDEHFYIVNVGDDKTILYSKYSLNVGIWADTRYSLGRQLASNIAIRRPCVNFSSIAYWYDSNGVFNTAYGVEKDHNNIYDSTKNEASGINYSVAYYITNYVDYLKSIGAQDIEGRLLTFDEIINYFNISYYDNYDDNNSNVGPFIWYIDAPKWLYNVDSWVASSRNMGTNNSKASVWIIYNKMFYNVNSNYNSKDGVTIRPTIEVPSRYL